jgi:methylenetetrahydrofolate dehydrogenase (NADP+) / methenyltetrahydrofolate cyclohydrolase
MIVDGKAIAADIREKLKAAYAALPAPLTLGIVVAGNDPVIESFVRIKKRFADTLGVKVEELRFPSEISAPELIEKIRNMTCDGIIVQLPLPAILDTNAVLNAIPIKRDVDVLSLEAMAAFRQGTLTILPPVAGAMQEILERAHVSVAGKDVLIIGRGRLVGAPAELLFRHNDAHVTVVGRGTNLAELAREADIIVSGAGEPLLIKPDMLKAGAALIDAGTSESKGKIIGDADPRCADVASVFTPVPGGVGPIAVAMIFKNLLILARQRVG